MKKTLHIDETLLRAAKQASGAATDTETVRLDPVAALLTTLPGRVWLSVINGRVRVEDGELRELEIGPIIGASQRPEPRHDGRVTHTGPGYPRETAMIPAAGMVGLASRNPRTRQ